MQVSQEIDPDTSSYLHEIILKLMDKIGIWTSHLCSKQHINVRLLKCTHWYLGTFPYMHTCTGNMHAGYGYPSLISMLAIMLASAYKWLQLTFNGFKYM